MKSVIKFVLPAVLILTIGCISWDEGWKTKVKATGQGDVKALYTSALSLESSADSGDKIKNIITAYEKVTAIEPENYDALVKVGEFAHLYAFIYATDKNVKEEYYLKSIKNCERAMYTNPKFRVLADQGKPAWECAETLTSKEMAAMFYWYVAAGQYWTECFSPLSHLINFRFAARGNTILQRMTALEPDSMNGRIHMAWGSAYSILPGIMGGDVKKSADEFTRAIKAGPDTLVNFYCRAKYLHVKTGDRDAFKKDLEFVLAADLKKVPADYAWNVGYQMKAKELLGKIDELF